VLWAVVSTRFNTRPHIGIRRHYCVGGAPIDSHGDAACRWAYNCPGVSNRILIVDDNPDDVAMLEAFLNGEASSIRAETQSRHAEAAIAEFDPDLVLLDLHMPEPDGMEILRRIRSVRQSAGFLPVIVITGEDNASARNSALVLGADDFLSKPLDRQEVVLRVRNLLRTRRLYVELANTNTALKNRIRAAGRTGQT